MNKTKQINTFIKGPLGVLAGFGLILFILLNAVDRYSFDKAFYAHVYDHLGTAETIGISDEDLDKSTNVLLDYIKDDRLDIDVDVTLEDGTVEPMFNEREIMHMVDVKDLYLNAMKVKWIGLSFFILTSILFIFRYGWKNGSLHLFRAYRISLILFGTIVLVLTAFILLDFDRFWTSFHHVFFTNDLWILNPATDRMILMVPSYFFNELVKRIVYASIGGMVFSFIVLYLVKHTLKTVTPEQKGL